MTMSVTLLVLLAAFVAAIASALGKAPLRKQLKVDEDAVATKIIATMRKHGKDYYKRDGLEIRIELAAEKVKVTRRRDDEEEDADA